MNIRTAKNWNDLAWTAVDDDTYDAADTTTAT